MYDSISGSVNNIALNINFQLFDEIHQPINLTNEYDQVNFYTHENYDKTYIAQKLMCASPFSDGTKLDS